MLVLGIVSLIWAFSFGLIKRHLSGFDPLFVSWVRLALALVTFLPFLHPPWPKIKTVAALSALGAVQFGLMYAAYIHSFRYLPAGLVALFTILTPMYVTLLDDLFRHSFKFPNLLRALLAVTGAAIISFSGTLTSADLVSGFFWVQLSNIAFATGQVWYRRLFPPSVRVQEARLFGFCYLGAVVFITISGWIMKAQIPNRLTTNQIIVLLYLGILASGVSFFLWNHGARRVGAGLLAVFNNVKIPLAVLAAILVFNEKYGFFKLIAGSGLMIIALMGPLPTRKNLFDTTRWGCGSGGRDN